VRCDDKARVSSCTHAQEQAQWDAEMDRDSAAGRLDFLFDEASREADDGLLHEWPPTR